MADQNNDVLGLGPHTRQGMSLGEEIFNNALERAVEPFYVAKSQVAEIFQEYIGTLGEVNYTLKPLNEQAVDMPLTEALNCNGKRVENIGVVQDLSSLAGILGYGNTAVSVNTLSAFMSFYSALNLILANPAIQTSADCKNLRLQNVRDAEIPTSTDPQPTLEQKIKGILTIGQLLGHFPTDILASRDALANNPTQPFFNCDERVLQRLLDPIANQDAVTKAYLQQISLNRGTSASSEYDCANRRIGGLQSPEEVKETMLPTDKTINLARAVNQQFVRDLALSKINSIREETPGNFTYNTVFDAKTAQIQNVGNATKPQDALPLSQATTKFIAKDGGTIDMGGKRVVNGIAGTDSSDFVIKSQLDTVKNQLQATIDDLGGSGGVSLLDILSLGASLTSIALNLSNLGLSGVGTGLTALSTIGASLASASVLGLASVQNDGSGNIVKQSNLKVSNDIADYTPDPTRPSNWAEQLVDINRMIQAQNDLKTAFGPASVGSAWLNSVLYAPAMMQKQNFGVFDVVI